MTVKEVIKVCATFLGRDNVIEYLDNPSAICDTVVYNTVNTLTRLTNTVVSELACNFLPMIQRETIAVNNGKLSYTQLSETPLEILGVYDELGKEISFEITEKYVEVAYPLVKVEYKYLPSAYGLEDKIGFADGKISVTALAYGVTAEFCLTEKAFEQSLLWHERYVDAVSKLNKPKNTLIRQRRFI